MTDSPASPALDSPVSRRPSPALRIALGLAMLFAIVGGILLAAFSRSHVDGVSQSQVGDLPGQPDPSPLVPTRERLAGADIPSVTDDESQEPVVVPAAQSTDSRFAFLLLGYGGGRHDGAYLTDSMIVVVVDPVGKTLTCLSLPRDAWVPMVFNGQTAVYNKVNTAYAFARDSSLQRDRLARYKGNQGPGTFVMDTVARLLGIPIPYYLALDFQGFRETIDLVGGIDVDVPNSFASLYPANDDPSIDPSWIVVRFERGLQRMSGARAMQYARAREAINNIEEGSDFARSRRQQLIMEAFKTRLTQPDALIHLPQLLGVAASRVDTNYSLPSVAQLAQLIADWKNVRFYQTALTGQNYLVEATGPGGAYILVPNSPERSWAQIRAFVRRLWENPEAGVAMAGTKVVVENGTKVPGLATRLSAVLARLGYRVGPPVDGPARVYSRIVVRTGGEAGALVSRLQADLLLRSVETVVESGTRRNEIVLQVGSGDASVADLAVAADASAPSSALGVQQSGWRPPQPETSTPTPTETPTPTPISASPTPRGTPTPLLRTPVTSTALPAGTPSPSIGTPGTPAATPRATLTPGSSPTIDPRATLTPDPLPTSTPRVTLTPGVLPTLTPRPSSSSTPTPVRPTATSSPGTASR